MAFYRFATHSNTKTLQHKRILFTYDTHTAIRLAQNSFAHYWEVGTRGDGSLMGAIGQKPLGVATSHGIQGGLVCSAVGKHWGFNHWSSTQFPLSENTRTLPPLLGVSKETLAKRLDPMSQKQGYKNCWMKARIPGAYLSDTMEDAGCLFSLS